MANLTEKQFEEAKAIIEKYRTILFANKSMDLRAFEGELRELWDLGYQEIKGVIVDLSEHGRCEQVAAYYMQHSNAPGPVFEFKRRLAELYGIKRYDSEERVAKQNEYWNQVFEDHV